MPSLKFRVLIDTAESEEIFRDILINESENFEVFYNAILDAFEFRGDQLASFYMSNDNWDKGHEIALLDMGTGDSSELSIMSETPLSELIIEKNQKLVLVYDFMKMWCFLIEVIDRIDQTFDDPEIVFSVGKSPDEDSKEMDLSSDMGMSATMDLGNDIDDIFSNLDDDDDEDIEFENFDDFDM